MWTRVNPSALQRNNSAGQARFASVWCLLLSALLPALVHSDQHVGIKTEALRLDLEVRWLADQHPSVAHPPLSVYLTSRADTLVIQSATLRIDDEKHRYDYSLTEAHAINEGAAHPLVRLPLSPGEHRLRAEVVALPGGDPRGKRVVARIDQPFSLPETGGNIELHLDNSGMKHLLGGASLVVRQHGAADLSLTSPSAQFFTVTGQYFQAISALQYAASRGVHISPATLTENTRAYGIAAASPPVNDPVYDRYNQAVALLESGSDEQGLAMLKALVDADYEDYDKQQLQDKVSLALGYYYLSRYLPSEAQEHFRRVRRLTGYANHALIGLGWALLKPDNPALAGSKTAAPAPGQSGANYLWSSSDDEVAWARRRAPFRRAWSVVSGAMKEDLRNALVPWMELIADDPFDPAVQEGMLIIPYAMTHMGDFAQAERYYLRAQEQLLTVRSSIQARMQHVQSGQLSTGIDRYLQRRDNGWDAWLARVIADPATEYVNDLISNPGFLDAVQDYRTLSELDDAMREHRQHPALEIDEAQPLRDGIDAVLARIHSKRHDARQRMELAALASLSVHYNRVETYLAEAGFALARIHDSPRLSGGATPQGRRP